MRRFILASLTVFIGGFALADETAPAPDGWQPQIVRDEIAPRFWVQYSKEKERDAEYELGMEGRGSEVLDGRCDVLLSGTTPQARFWTLTLYDPEGRLVANSAQRQGFTSQEIVRNADGSFDVLVGPRARPGNWLPTGGVDKYLLVLRLYDTPIGMASRTGSEAPMPALTKRACL